MDNQGVLIGAKIKDFIFGARVVVINTLTEALGGKRKDWLLSGCMWSHWWGGYIRKEPKCLALLALT